MKEIITKVTEPIYVTIQKGNKTRAIKQYEADDGTIFDEKVNAEQWNIKLKFDKIEHIESNIVSELGDSWYKAKTKEELELLKKKLVWSYSRIYGLDQIKVGEWFNYHVEYGGDYQDIITFITLSEFKKEIFQLLNLLER